MIELEKSNCRKKLYEEKISRSRKTKLQWNSYNSKFMWNHQEDHHKEIHSILQKSKQERHPILKKAQFNVFNNPDAYLYAPNQIKYENQISFNSIRKLKS